MTKSFVEKTYCSLPGNLGRLLVICGARICEETMRRLVGIDFGMSALPFQSLLKPSELVQRNLRIILRVVSLNRDSDLADNIQRIFFTIGEWRRPQVPIKRCD